MFLAGYLISKNSAGNQNQQALINNSLVDRFQGVQEKRVPPAGLFALSRDRASFPVLSADGSQVLYYNSDNGEIRAIATKDLSSSSTLVAKIQPSAIHISWAANKTLIATYLTGSIFYDLNSGSSKKLDQGVRSPVLNRAGDKLAYIYFDDQTGEGNISIADPSGEFYKVIMPTRSANWQIGWVGNNTLSLVRPPIPENPTYALLVLDTETKSLSAILDSKNNLEVVWSPDNQKIIYSYSTDPGQESKLYFMNLSDREEVGLSAAVNASKCTWSIDNKTVYCATGDSFVTIDTSATVPAPEAIPALPSEIQNSASTATNLLLTSTEDYLIFRNSQNGKLYGLNLSK